MMKVAIIRADGDLHYEDVASIDLAYLRDQVGGHIEALRIPGTGITFYLNEDGKLLGLPANASATAIARRNRAVSFTDAIVGNVVVVGPADKHGDDTGLSEEQIVWLEKELSVDEILELLSPDPWGQAATRPTGPASSRGDDEAADE